MKLCQHLQVLQSQGRYETVLFVIIHERPYRLHLKKRASFRAQARFLQAHQAILHSDQNCPIPKLWHRCIKTVLSKPFATYDFL